MKRALLAWAACCLLTAGCSDSKVVVHASMADAGTPIPDLPVWILPYDRQALADSLADAADMDEPMVPAELVTQLEGLSAQEAAATTDSARHAARAQRLALLAEVDSVRVRRSAWREAAFADFDSLSHLKEGELGRTARVDTTGADGSVSVKADEGRWWAWAVYVLPDQVLEWNVPVTLRGDSAVVTLTRDNAESRAFY